MPSCNNLFSHHWVEILYILHKENYKSISNDDLADAINKINNNDYQLSPLFRIYFTPGVIVGSEMCYKGVAVHPISENPPVDLGIAFEFTTYYMKPLDELVLSALGKLLLQIHYPEYLDGDHVGSINDSLFNESREKGAKGIAGLVYIETGGNEFLMRVVFHYLLVPYLYYIDGEEVLMPMINGDQLHSFLDTGLPVHYFAPIYRVPFFYEYLAFISHKIEV
jgi:hypothetical protein